ncbi:hypothetical protein AAEO50_01215 [Rossellomorea oryzaecorticis]|uniref:Uncharacterized protein n=1 Tax=Rossellomorea oryzaecorticis TaxID=1396505 RepID=A0ABU9K467_9BACI
MKLKILISQCEFWWHSIRMHYHQALLDSCLDCRLKKKIQQKIMYHEMKLNNY